MEADRVENWVLRQGKLTGFARVNYNCRILGMPTISIYEHYCQRESLREREKEREKGGKRERERERERD